MKVYAQVTRRKQRFRAKKSLITDEYEEELKTLKMWYCAYCEYEDNSQNGLKAHLSKGFHNAEDLHERYVNIFEFQEFVYYNMRIAYRKTQHKTFIIFQ